MTQLEQQTMYMEIRMPRRSWMPGAAREEIDQKLIPAGWVNQDNLYEPLEDVVTRRS